MHAIVVPLLAASVAHASRAPDPEPPPAPVATGSGWHCAVREGGTVGCWGAPAAELPGDPRRTDGSPVALDGVQRVAAGPDHACAVTNGRVACWGDNQHGQLGDGTTDARSEPVVLDLSGAIDVSAGSEHTCAVTDDGKVWCWGENGNGQLGTASWNDSATPVRVPGVGRASSVRAGRDFTCALRTDGTVTCWGADVTGAGGPGTIRTLPTPVPGLTDAVAIDAGFGQACAATRAGGLTCWGRVGGRAQGPVAVDVTDAVGVAVGYDHACALRADGSAECWGVGEFGRLGDGTCTDSPTPVKVKGLAGATAIDASWTHTCATVGDDVWCWGGNWTGEIPLQGKPRPCDASFAEPIKMGAN